MITGIIFHNTCQAPFVVRGCRWPINSTVFSSLTSVVGIKFPCISIKPLRMAAADLADQGPIEVHDSLPYGEDSVDTLHIPDVEMQVMADRLSQELPEEPNLESASEDPVPLSIN